MGRRKLEYVQLPKQQPKLRLGPRARQLSSLYMAEQTSPPGGQGEYDFQGGSLSLFEKCEKMDK